MTDSATTDSATTDSTMTDDAIALESETTFAGCAMASPLRLTVVGIGDEAAASAWAATRAEFEAAEQAMSRFRDDSDVTRLNRVAGTGQAPIVDRRLTQALVAADRATRLTGARFDPRVLVDLDRLGDIGVPVRKSVPISTSTPARDARTFGGRVVSARTSAGRIVIDDPVDLGGIGKGLALRWAAAGLGRARVDRFLIDAGGDLVARGGAADGGPWQVGVEDPFGGAEPIAVIGLTDGAVATSSIRRRQWRHEGRLVHHLVDPATGEPADGGLRAVTVAAADPAWSEVWSKALFIGGLADIACEARARGLAAWWVTVDGRLEMTAAARQRTMWVAGEA